MILPLNWVWGITKVLRYENYSLKSTTKVLRYEKYNPKIENVTRIHKI